ncbi:hypothetical protein C8F04DRAFT_1325849 [Mycena alexandri]|uniref:Uncharacterized protein n=1 Tax=Mycena alexandri TaxID=1745969 RepID=A0AAD6RZW9_9AGAR|nr:hypothetical protein C8F04DRAFT_1325849 [Mycena alexandri]
MRAPRTHLVDVPVLEFKAETPILARNLLQMRGEYLAIPNKYDILGLSPALVFSSEPGLNRKSARVGELLELARAALYFKNVLLHDNSMVFNGTIVARATRSNPVLEQTPRSIQIPARSKFPLEYQTLLEQTPRSSKVPARVPNSARANSPLEQSTRSSPKLHSSKVPAELESSAGVNSRLKPSPAFEPLNQSASRSDMIAVNASKLHSCLSQVNEMPISTVVVRPILDRIKRARPVPVISSALNDTEGSKTLPEIALGVAYMLA